MTEHAVRYEPISKDRLAPDAFDLPAALAARERMRQRTSADTQSVVFEVAPEETPLPSGYVPAR